MGLALVRRDGRPARRIQCAWRALLVWAPVATLAAGSAWLDFAYLQDWQNADASAWLLDLSVAAWWSAVALLAIDVAPALAFPRRALHIGWPERM